MASRHSGGGRGRGRFRKPNKTGDSFSHEKEDKRNVDESSPVIQAFRVFQKELDGRNDRHERIVKLSRDITIESKRIIFLLQRCAGSEDRGDVLKEAAAKFEELYATKFYQLASELDGQDPYQFLRAYSPGLQEYIEAVTFYHYLLDEHLIEADKVQSDLIFTRKAPKTESTEDPSAEVNSVQKTNVTVAPSPTDSDASVVLDSQSDTHINSHQDSGGHIAVHVPQSEYMLGVADFTGELMRMAINSVGAGDLETPSLVTNMMRVIHCAFTNFGNTPRELRQKTRVLSQSLQKVERACYTLRVRGSEIPKHMLADVFSSAGSSMPTDSFNADELDEHYD